MTEKKRLGKIRSFLNLVTIVPTLFSFTANVAALVSNEVRLAKHGLIKIIIFSLLSLVVFMTLWSGILILFVVCLINLAHWNMILAIAMTIIINIVLLIIFSLCIKKYQKEMGFENTKHLLNQHLNPFTKNH